MFTRISETLEVIKNEDEGAFEAIIHPDHHKR